MGTPFRLNVNRWPLPAQLVVTGVLWIAFPFVFAFGVVAEAVRG